MCKLERLRAAKSLLASKQQRGSKQQQVLSAAGYCSERTDVRKRRVVDERALAVVHRVANDTKQLGGRALGLEAVQALSSACVHFASVCAHCGRWDPAVA